MDGLTTSANLFVYELPPVYFCEGISTLHLVSCVNYRLFDGFTTATVLQKRKKHQDNSKQGCL